jgi:hypothetical protein
MKAPLAVAEGLRGFGFVRRGNGPWILIREVLPLFATFDVSKGGGYVDLRMFCGEPNTANAEFAVFMYSQGNQARRRGGGYRLDSKNWSTEVQTDFERYTIPFIRMTESVDRLCEGIASGEVLAATAAPGDEFERVRNLWTVSSAYGLDEWKSAAETAVRKLRKNRKYREAVDYWATLVRLDP